MRDKLKPEEYEKVLVYDANGNPIIAYRSGVRWYGYTLLGWLTFEPTEFLPLSDMEELRARAEKAEISTSCAATMLESMALRLIPKNPTGIECKRYCPAYPCGHNARDASRCLESVLAWAVQEAAKREEEV